MLAHATVARGAARRLFDGSGGPVERSRFSRCSPCSALGTAVVFGEYVMVNGDIHLPDESASRLDSQGVRKAYLG